MILKPSLVNKRFLTIPGDHASAQALSLWSALDAVFDGGFLCGDVCFLSLSFIATIYRYFDSLLLYAAVSYTTQLVPLIGCGCFARE
ncbi:hypothetical protein ACTXNH_02945 [Psychrobacter celer]|uniref:hypothetical protein n=1 Tax=Psychrobacter celer TaxID=306572 RepID=UPI003FCF8988